MRRLSAFPLLVPFIGFLLPLFPPARGGEIPHPWNNKRVYYVVERGGRLREKGYFIRRAGSWRKTPCVVTEEDRFYFLEGDTLTPARSVKVRVVAASNGEAIQRYEEVVIGDPGRESITVDAGEIRFKNTGSFGEDSLLPAPPGVVFDVSGEWLAAHALQAGASFPIEVLERRARRVRGETVTLLEQAAPAGGGNPAVWLAEFNSPGRLPMLARFTSDGRLIRLETGDLAYQVVGRDDFELGRIPAAAPPSSILAAAPESMRYAPPASGDGGIPAGLAIPSWDSFAWMRFRSGPFEQWSAAIPASEYSRIEFNGVDAGVVTLRNAPRVDTEAAFPMRLPADVQAYLSLASGRSAEAALIEAARLAVLDGETRREEKNVLRAVSYLAGWINQNISLLPWSGGNAQPARILADRSGDALDQARLFAALAAALGAPSRLCQGLLARSGLAIPHAWNEVWINGVWTPVDATVNRVGLPAGYVLAERSGPGGEFAGGFASFLRSPGLWLSLASAGRETPGGAAAELVAGDRRSYAYAEGDWLANLFWGFALRLPPGWIGSAKLDSVEAASPERSARFKCEALAGDYAAGRGDLERMTAGLKSDFNRFRVIDSRIASFDADGALPVLFVDFTCLENGESLRCRQYLLPRRRRAFRLSFWAPVDGFDGFAPYFDSILAAFEF
ncbi:MAG: transglutaminase domain-containing protein [Planctomycetota bacterium]|jgi:transglutaminase-like putative cysteine protease|nr:transglutaminase domain-containing protein [Planctomycetota bacterium]